MNPSTSLRARRVLIFSLAYVPFVGGAELAIKEITDRLDPQEYEFDMVTLRFDKRLPRIERIGNVTVHRIGFASKNAAVSDRALSFPAKVAKLLFPLASFLKARRLHRAQPYDAIWAMMANQAGFGALFFKMAYPRVPYLLELQDGTPLSQIKTRRPITALLWPLYRAIYRRADAVKAISKFVSSIAREAGYRGKVEVIPNGVDVRRFSAPVPDTMLLALKAKFDKRMGDIFLFTASRLVLSRGVEDIIQALRHLSGEVKLLVAGDGEDRAKLERIAKDAGVASRVIFAGHVAHGDLPAYFKLSDIFVRPSLIEGMGSAFVEAFAAGIPVVATPVGGITDFLFDPAQNSKPTGLFCKPRDPLSVAEAVRRYLDDPALVADVVQNARELAAQKYDWDTIARDMKTKLFDKLIRG